MSDIATWLIRFREGPGVMAAALDGLSAGEQDFVRAPGKWSIRQIVAHVADAELVGAHRLRQVIAEKNPTLVAFDQDAWTENLDYARRDPRGSLESFQRVRSENYELMKDLPPAAWERTGNHTENGPMTLRRLLEGYAQHAESHAREIREIREAYCGSKGQ